MGGMTGSRWLRRMGQGFIILLGGMAVLFLFMLFMVARQQTPSFEEVRSAYRSSYVDILDRNGQRLQQLRLDFQARRGEWTALEEASPALQEALLASEDRRFYNHHGVDGLALLGALSKRLSSGYSGGASTITMQLVGMLDEQLHRQKRSRSYRQKINQIIMAQALERHWSKAQILEAYMNMVPFRGELVGIGSASRALLQKYPAGLDSREAAMLAALLRAPNASTEKIAGRTCQILRYTNPAQNCDYLVRFVGLTLDNQQRVPLGEPALAPHYANAVLSLYKNSGQPVPAGINTTLDKDLQEFALQSVRHNIRQLQKSNANDAAAVVLENRTGHILAYIGSSAELASAAHVDHAIALRQAGSTLKPFLYAQALDQQRLTSASLLNDSPVNLATGNGLYIPQNYDRQFSGWVSMRVALASSLNIPAVRTLTMVTPNAFQHLLSRLGLPLEQSGDFYGYSLALGSAEVSLLSLANAFRALANEGMYSAVDWAMPFSLNEEQVASGPRAVIQKASAWIIADILSDRQARAVTFGLDSQLSTPFWTAVKTGTSKDMRDNWTVGWSQDYTVAVWVGNSTGASMHEVSGVSGAGPIWHEVMGYLHQNRVSKAPPMPEGVVAKQVFFEQNLEPSRTEYFLSGTEQETIAMASSLQTGHGQSAFISHPSHDTIIALDPDIPAENQRLVLRAGNVSARPAGKLLWYINGRFFANTNPSFWQPMPGRHQLEIRSEEGKTLDSVSVQVRGAYLKENH